MSHVAQFRPVVARAPHPYGYGGRGRISVTVDELGAVGAYRVALIARDTLRVVGSAISGTDGVVVFENLAVITAGYFAVAFDHGDNPLNAAVADMLTPEPMP